MTKKADKERRTDDIRRMVAEFAAEHLDAELAGFADRLLGKLSRMRKLDIAHGRPEIWAGTIVYLIARLNFLFDADNPLYLTGNEIAEYFGAAKSTIQNKAGIVEKACRLHRGHPDYSRAEIADMLTTVELPGGIVMPMDMFKRTLAAEGLAADARKDGTISIREMDEEESRELERLLAEREQQRAEAKAQQREAPNRRRREAQDEKRRRDGKRQPDLFD